MSTHNIGFYYEMTNITFQISSNTHLICSSEIGLICLIPDTPDAPSNLEIESFDKRSCNLKWKPPTHDGGNPIKGGYLTRQNV